MPPVAWDMPQRFSLPTLLFALLALAVGALQAVLMWLQPGSDSDFAGLCCFAEALSRGINPTNPYFPPGYPALLVAGVKLGLDCLHTAALLNGIGAALAVYHCCALWKRFGMSTVAALFPGLVLPLLPDLVWTMQMAHTDTLMLGLLASWLHAALAALRGDASRQLQVGGIAAAAIAALCRWHLVLALLPVLIVLLLAGKRVRRFAVVAALTIGASLLFSYALLFAATGQVQTSAKLQVFTGLALTAADSDAAITELTEDYGVFAESHRQASLAGTVGLPRLVSHTLQNWVKYLSVRATLAGLLAIILAGLIWRRVLRGSAWLVLFILGYSLAISPSYFVYRASVIVEWCGLVALGAALTVASSALQRWPWRAAGLLATCLLLVYAVPRAAAGYRQALANRAAPLAAEIAQLASRPEEVLGWNDYHWCLTAHPWNLPAASLNRLWLDDPALQLVTSRYPRYTLSEVLNGESQVKLIIFNRRERWASIPQVRGWAEVQGFAPYTERAGYTLWLRRD